MGGKCGIGRMTSLLRALKAWMRRGSSGHACVGEWWSRCPGPVWQMRVGDFVGTSGEHRRRVGSVVKERTYVCMYTLL